MPKPIYMNDDMVTECFADVRAAFEKQFAEALERAKSGKSPLARGLFTFQSISYDWTNDKSRARVVIDPVAYSKICILMYGTDKEIGWHGYITRDPENPNVYHLEDVILYPQTVTSITVQTDDEKYVQWVNSIPNEPFAKLRYHGHSHVNMGVTPSGTDLTYYASLIKQFKDGFYVFMIINKKMDIFCQVYDFDNNSMYETSEVDVVVGDNFVTKLKDDQKVMVTNSTAYSYGNYYNGKRYGDYGGLGGYDDYDDHDHYGSHGRTGSGYGPQNGSWKKNNEQQSVLSSSKEEKKESAGSESSAGVKNETADEQSALHLPPYVDDNEEAWYKSEK